MLQTYSMLAKKKLFRVKMTKKNCKLGSIEQNEEQKND